MGKYPNCEKLREAEPQRTAILDFLSWLYGQEISLEKNRDVERPHCNAHRPVHESYDSMIMRFLGIDQKELERERQAILDDIRGG
jgi:hypothetical protein